MLVWPPLAAAAALLVPAAGAGHGAAPATLRDRPELRLRATNAWYGEGRVPLDSRSGPFSASYRRFLARTAVREASASRAATTADPQPAWTNLGPTKATFATNGYTLNVTDSGRPRSIIVNGSTIYVASSNGGVWKSTNSGSTWSPLSDSLSSLSDGSLAMDPNNSSVLYLGFGDPFDGTGIGLVKSTDGGANWSSPVTLGNETKIEQVLVDPGNSNVVLAGTNDGLYRSTNAGTSFSQVSIATGDIGAPRVWSIASTGTHSFVLSLEGSPATTSGTTDGQVWTSTDDGANWTQATGMTKASGVGRITVASAPSSPQTVYAMAAVPNPISSSDLADIFKSTDGGQTWTALNAVSKQYSNPNSESANVSDLLNGQGWYNQMVAVDPSNANTVYFGGSLLIAKTTDGGSTFSEISNWLGQFGLPYVHADCHTAAFDANGNLYVGTDGGISKTTNGGTTFSGALNVGLIDHLMYSVASSPDNSIAVIGGLQDLGTRLREGSTSTFDQVVGGDGFGADINRTNADAMLGSVYFDDIRKTTDGGSSWSAATNGITEAGDPNSTSFFTKLVPWEGDSTGNTLYTFSNFTVYETTDYATSWAPLATAVTNTGAIRNVGVAPSDGNDVGVVASSGRVFLSPDGGATWNQAASLPNDQFSLSFISFDPNDPDTVYVSSVAPTQNASHLWKSTNAGASWSSVDGYGGSANGFPTGVGVNVVKVDPLSSSTLYAGTQLGLYRSTDGGSTWSQYGTGLPLVGVDDIYIAPDDSRIRLGTYGRGFWELQPTPIVSHSLSVSTDGSGSGSVTSSPRGIACGSLCSTSWDAGQQLTLTATPDAGSVFAGWSGGGCAGTGDCVVTLNADTAVTATFTQVQLHDLTVAKAGTGSGGVTSSPPGIDCGSTCFASFDAGTQVTLTATPAVGSTFAGWSGGGCSGTGTCQVTLNADTVVTATFALKPKPHCVVPKVKGKTLAAAKRAITGAHCAVGTVRHAWSKRVRKGRVISQSPAPGKRLAAGAKVGLVISKGRR